jgi:dipeptidyl aminopeptidase/acylaminoacyl peptidase
MYKRDLVSRKSRFAVLGAVAGLLVCQSAQAAPNGSKIAYMSTKAGWAVHTVGTDGLGDQRLTNTPGSAFDGEPDWSPDGQRIAYVCGNFEVCVMNADGSGQAKLTSTQTSWPTTFSYELDPVWSPDGTRIAFASNRDLTRYDIFVASADGSSVTRLGGTAADDTQPSWSPDGSQIVFASEATGNGDLYVMNADGSGIRRLTTKKTIESNPDWSPDGTQIAFELLENGQTDLAVVRPDGTGRRRLTKTPSEDDDPAWSPDGTQLVFSSDSSGNWDVFLRLPGGRQRLTNGLTAEFAPSWQPAPTAGLEAKVALTPPTTPTDDARVVAEFMRWDSQILGESTGIFAGTTFAAVKMSATACRKDASRAKRVLTALHPVTPRGQQVRRRSLQSFAVAHAFSSHIEAGLTLLQQGKRKQASFYIFLGALERLAWDTAASSAYQATRLP